MRARSCTCGGWVDRVRGASVACWASRLRRLRTADTRNIALFCNWGSGEGEAARCAEAGLETLLEMLDREQARITFNLAPDLCRTHPQRVRQVAEAGHEVAWLAAGLERRLSVARLREMLESIKGCFTQVELRARGFYSPRPTSSLRLLRCLHEHGFVWTAQHDGARRPYRLIDQLIRVPVLLDDCELIEHRVSPQRLMNTWHERIGRAVRRGRVVAIGLHAAELGRQNDYAAALQAQLHFLRRILELKITSISELAGVAPTRPVSGPS